ncbi:MAG: hypothetical protein WC792_05350 [Candidatus Micrarchaeia archaeon]|jgi:hypothetical protein
MASSSSFSRFSLLFAAFSFFAATFVAADVMNVSAPFSAFPSGNLTVSGNLFSNSNLSGPVNGTNVTIYVDGVLYNYSTTGASGNASIMFGAPFDRGQHNITINTTDGNVSKQFPFFVSNVSSGNASFVGAKLPPFSAGETFTVQVTALNSTGSPVSGTQLDAKIFADMGKEQTAWTVSNLSATTDSNGVMQFNITAPSGTASGQYALLVERGAIVLVFNIRSGYVIAINTQTTSEEITANFYPTQTVMLLAKMRTLSGDPVTNATINAQVTAPNGTSYSVSLTAANQTASPGQYNNTFSGTGTTGTYEVRVLASVDSTTVETFSSFDVKDLSARLSEEKEFSFDPFQQGKSFKPGGIVRLNALVYNLTDGSILTGAVSGATASQANCSATQVYDVYYAANGSSVTIAANNTNVTGSEFSTTVCAINFTAPDASGYFGVRVNLSLGSGAGTANAEGFISVQRYALKANPVTNMGGGFNFMTVFTPGDNATFQIKAFNLSSGTSGASVATGASSAMYITNVTKLTPLEFGTGQTAIVAPNHWIENASDTVTITIPSGTIGPYIAEVIANIGGEEVHGSAFFMTKYVEGFLFSGGESGGPGGPGSEGGPKGSACNGTTTFNGFVFDVKTSQGAQGVQFNSIQEARSEQSGKDVSACLSMTPGTTDSNGQASVSVAIANNASCTWSGFYFMLINVTYQGNSDLIPSGFQCKNLNFFPQIQSVGASNAAGGWQVAPNAILNVTLSSVTYVNNTPIPSGTLTFPRMMNFNPGAGGKLLQNNTPLSVALATNGTGNTLLYPSNFTASGVALTRWPNGFMDIQPQVCAGAICDTSFGGFQVVAFDAWVDFGFGGSWGQQYGTGQNASSIIVARTNVSSVGSFSIQIGRPWEGNLITVPANETYATLLTDGWNNTNDSTGPSAFSAFERWNVTYTIPAGVPKGGSDTLITVNNSAGDTTETHTWLNIVKFSVAAPSDEGVQDMRGYPVADPFGNALSFGIDDLYAQTGWNYNYTNGTLGFSSKSGFVGAKSSLTTRNFCSFNASETNWNGSVTAPALRILLLDTVTPGEIDTILVSNISCWSANCSVASKTLKVVNVSSASSRQMWYDGNASFLYFRNAEGCCFAKMANANSSGGCGGNWIGTYQADTKFYIPYVVTKGGVKEVGANVSVQGVIKQDLKAGGSGGFGFQNNLASSTYATEQATTDSNGIAFVGLTVSDSGAFSVFWNMTTATDSDAATFESGSQAEIKRFSTQGGKANFTRLGLVTMTQVANNSGVWFDSPGGAPELGPYYQANVVETTAGDFLNMGTPQSYYLFFGANSSFSDLYLKLAIDDDNVTAQGTDGPATLMFSNEYLNGTLRPNVNSGPPLNAEFKVANNPTFDAATQQVLLFQRPNSFDQMGINGSTTGNSTVYVCAETFDRPNPGGVANATVNLTTQVYGMGGPGGPTTYAMSLYDPVTGSSDVRTGASGCAIFNFSPPSGFSWPCWGNLQGTVSKNLSDTLNATPLTFQNFSMNASAYVVANVTTVRLGREAFRFGNTRVRSVALVMNDASGTGINVVTGDVLYKDPATGLFVKAAGNATYFPDGSNKSVGAFQSALGPNGQFGNTTTIFVQDNSTYYFTFKFFRDTPQQGQLFGGNAKYGEGIGTDGAVTFPFDNGRLSISNVTSGYAPVTYLRGSFTEQVYVANVNNQTACGGPMGGGGFGP